MNAPEDQNGLREALARAEARIAELTRQVFVPGMLKCAKCGFVLISATLNAQDGTVTARNTTEHCPNDGAPMWRVSEREAGNDMVDRAEEQMRRAIAAEVERDEALERMRMFAEAYLVSAETSDIMIDRAAEAEITRLKEGVEARERANDRLMEMVEKLVLNATTGNVPRAIIVAAGDLLDTLSQEHPHGYYKFS